MPRYAENTTVPAERSQAEIQQTLRRYGATGFVFAQDDERHQAMIQFRAQGRMVKLVLPLPDPDDEAFRLTPQRRTPRSPQKRREAYEQEVRRRWRSLALFVKATLEAVEAGIITFDRAFLAHLMLPDGRTVAQHLQPRIETAYATGEMPALLPDYSEEAS